MGFKWPSKATLLLSLVAGALAVLNTTTFQPGPPWQTGINVALLAFSAFGIAPLLGPAWRAAVELTPQETALAAGVLTFLQLLNQTEVVTTAWHAAVQAVLVIAAGLGFGPNATALVKQRRLERREARLRSVG